MIYMGSSQSLIKKFKVSIKKTFELTDLGVLHYFLWLQVMKIEYGVFVSQQKYVEDLLNRFNLQGSYSVSTLINSNAKLHVSDSSENADNKVYRIFGGGMLYLS